MDVLMAVVAAALEVGNIFLFYSNVLTLVLYVNWSFANTKAYQFAHTHGHVQVKTVDW